MKTRRHAFRPAALDSLETRVVLSHAGSGHLASGISAQFSHIFGHHHSTGATGHRHQLPQHLQGNQDLTAFDYHGQHERADVPDGPTEPLAQPERFSGRE